MPSFLSAAALMALTATAMAGPIEKRGSHTVSQVSRGSAFKNGAIEVAKAHEKFGKPIPAHVLKAAKAAASGTVVASPLQYDEAYTCPVTAGSSNLHLDFDTGSADLWAFSSLQSSSQTSGHSTYNVKTGKVVSGSTWSISYGDGSSASGNVYTDKVTIGSVSVAKQAVEAATQASSEFTQDAGVDGLVGLAFSSINTVSPSPVNTFFDNLSPTLAKPLFCANLKYQAAGSYDFGFIDTTQFTGSPTYVSVDNSQGFWQFEASGYSVGGSKKKTSESLTGIADTGTTLIYVPDDVVSAYYAKVQGAQNDSNQGGYDFPCSATLPDFSITIGGKAHTVPGKYINYAPVDSTGTTCFGGIQSSSSIGINIFGDIFLKSQYVIFENSGSPQIGFAQKV